MAKITVIIPAYNSDKYIAQTLDSVLTQTFKDYEVIIVDDESKDKTAEICQDYVKEYPEKIRYLIQKNQGPAAARNTGIKNAKGEFIAFLDADDLWISTKLEKQLEIFTKNPEIGLLATGRIKFNDQTGIEKISEGTGKITKYNYIDLWKQQNPVITSSAFIRKTCFDVAGLFDECKEISGTEDWDMWLRISEHSEIAHLDLVLVKYRANQQGYSRSNIERAYASAAYAIEKHVGELKKRCPEHKEIVRNIWARHYFYYGQTLLNLKRPKEAHAKFLTALKYNPFDFAAALYFVVTCFDDTCIQKIKNGKYLKKMKSKINALLEEKDKMENL